MVISVSASIADDEVAVDDVEFPQDAREDYMSVGGIAGRLFSWFQHRFDLCDLEDVGEVTDVEESIEKGFDCRQRTRQRHLDQSRMHSASMAFVVRQCGENVIDLLGIERRAECLLVFVQMIIEGEPRISDVARSSDIVARLNEHCRVWDVHAMRPGAAVCVVAVRDVGEHGVVGARSGSECGRFRRAAAVAIWCRVHGMGPRRTRG